MMEDTLDPILFREVEDTYNDEVPVELLFVESELTSKQGHAMGNSMVFNCVDDAIFSADVVSQEYLTNTHKVISSVPEASIEFTNLVFLESLRSDCERIGIGTKLLQSFEYHCSLGHDVTVVYGNIPVDGKSQTLEYSSSDFLRNFYENKGYTFLDDITFYKVINR